jgi:hypothetical protein
MDEILLLLKENVLGALGNMMLYLGLGIFFYLFITSEDGTYLSLLRKIVLNLVALAGVAFFIIIWCKEGFGGIIRGFFALIIIGLPVGLLAALLAGAISAFTDARPLGVIAVVIGLVGIFLAVFVEVEWAGLLIMVPIYIFLKLSDQSDSD